ncbi:MATE family efflux transporter [Holophaga foetida]|uniref:MATE family efflux transporter n=1 Tax=Holophaga foetida TaxID=35839 RepID=UPI000247430C|nr:MATE family efflux transporter [Holophaga foetida]
MQTTQRLAEEKPIKLLIQFSIPAIVGMLVSALYSVIDRIFIGGAVGSIGIAGITVAFPIMIIQLAFGLLVGIGGTALVSIRLGEKKHEEALGIVGNAFVLLIVISILISILGLIFRDPMLRAFGASEQVLPYARDFVTIILYGSVVMSTSLGMNNFIRAEGKPQKAMASMLIGTVMNIILAPIFLFVFKWGMKGAAWATVIAQVVSCTWVVSHFFSRTSTLRLYRRNMRLSLARVKAIMAIGMPPFFLQIAVCILTIVLNKSMEHYGGDTAVSGMGAVTTIQMLVILPIAGISMGAQPIIGFNYGARSFDRVREVLKMAIISGSTIAVLGWLMIQIFSTPLMAMFAKQDHAFVAFGSRALRIFSGLMFLAGFQVVASNYFQAIGKPLASMLLTLSRQVLILLPAILVLGFFFQVNGILVAGPIADVCSTTLTGIWLVRELRSLREQHAASN